MGLGSELDRNTLSVIISISLWPSSAIELQWNYLTKYCWNLLYFIYLFTDKFSTIFPFFPRVLFSFYSLKVDFTRSETIPLLYCKLSSSWSSEIRTQFFECLFLLQIVMFIPLTADRNGFPWRLIILDWVATTLWFRLHLVLSNEDIGQGLHSSGVEPLLSMYTGLGSIVSTTESK